MKSKLVITLMMLSVATIAYGAYIPAKGLLAQVLLQHAWHTSLQSGNAHKPWPWADTTTVARLRAPEHDVDLVVLAGAGGNSLAFGPGHVSDSGEPGSNDTIILGGHRGTHFSFLQKLEPGDVLELQNTHGTIHSYRVNNSEIANIWESQLRVESDSETLALVTCYPFDGKRSGSGLRYVVSALRAEF